jgi:putative aldouronate transport system substrate-binding protein
MKKAILVLLSLLMVGFPLFAGGRQSGSSGSGPVELIWYVGGPGPQADTDLVLAEVNKYLLEKLNCTLRIIETDFGSYDQKMQMVIASQEPYDLCYTANWINNYHNNISRNAFLELDDLLPRYAPELWASTPVGGWEAEKVNGHIYGVPNQQIWAYTKGFDIEKAYLDRYGYMRNSIKNLDDLETFMALIKRDNPNMYPVSCSSMGIVEPILIGYDELIGGMPVGYVLTDPAIKIVNPLELPQAQDYLRRIRGWYQKGYIRPDGGTVTDAFPDIVAGRHPIGFTGNVKPGNEAMEGARRGREVVTIPLTDSWLTTGGIIATTTAVSRNSRNPEMAVRFLNLVNTDKHLYNLITLGIEGKHYRKIDANYIETIPNSGYNPESDWMYGNQFLAFFRPGQSITDWDETMAVNRNAKLSPALGFVVDTNPIQTEIASVSAVWSEVRSTLFTGSVDPDQALPDILARLNRAGNNRIIAEIQKQVDEWKKTR